ncbi:ion transporter, partial [Haladaptatus sp. W1]|uniref:ion transporter n=1 Tax=Haladaptatus sp. W1 TaxID=1897478 RepID=UPI00373FCFAF
MGSHGALRAPRDFRERVQFYLVDHRTPLGKAIDIWLLVLNLLFVGVFVAQTYSVSATTEAWLWRFEVGIALVFVVEYVLRMYGAQNRLAEFTNLYTMVDLLSVLPTMAVLFLPIPVIIINIGFLRVIRVVRVLRFYRFTQD